MRTWYHPPFYLLLFEEVRVTVYLIEPGWFDGLITRFEYALFGAHPTVWMGRFANASVTEYMNFAYFPIFY